MKSEKMSEEDLKRIEKKVDILYKLLFEFGEKGEEGDIPTLFRDSLDELIPLFKLSVKKEEFIKIKGRPQDIIKSELEKLENSFNQGNYLAKDEKKIQIKIDGLKEELEKANIGQNNKEQIERLNKEIHEIRLYQDFRKKMGRKTEYAAQTSEIDNKLGKRIDFKSINSELSKEGVRINFSVSRDYRY